jgi:NitT/TauT family transport system ATP-binding protein
VNGVGAVEQAEALAVKGVEVSFAGRTVLGPVSLTVAPGQCVALLGPSGCGKSTLLAALAGLLVPSSGSVSRFSSPPGMVFQDPTLMPWANARENVALPLVLSGVSKATADARAKEALTVVGLPDVAMRKPRELSGGMRMRVALARALVADPPALLLDEPFAAIDELGRRALNDLVHTVRRDRNLPVLFVTHSVEEAVYMADTVHVLSPSPGKIVASVPVHGDGTRDAGFLQTDAFAGACRAARAALARGVS